MLNFLNPEISNFVMVVLTILYFLLAAFTTFDAHHTAAKKRGDLSDDEKTLPEWTGVFIFLYWILWVIIFLLNWKYAIAIFIIKGVLNQLNILDIAGNFLAAPFKWFSK